MSSNLSYKLTTSSNKKIKFMRYILFYFFYRKIYLILNNYKNAVLLYYKMNYGLFYFILFYWETCKVSYGQSIFFYHL